MLTNCAVPINPRVTAIRTNFVGNKDDFYKGRGRMRVSHGVVTNRHQHVGDINQEVVLEVERT